MPSHTTMWMVAAGSAIASAALTYAVSQYPFVPAMRRARARIAGLKWPFVRKHFRSGWAPPVTSSNSVSSTAPVVNLAFQEYREETLRRLREEERAFHDFLDRLRMAKDRAEFDQFIIERRRPPPAPEAENAGLAQA